MRPRFYFSAGVVAAVSLLLSAFASRDARWITFSTPASSPLRFRTRFGLWTKSEATPFDLDQGDDGHTHWHSRPFPLRSRDCQADRQRKLDASTFKSAWLAQHVNSSSPRSDDASILQGSAEEAFGFCDLWRTAAYANSLGIAFQAASMLCMLVIVLPPFGGRRRREQGWKLVSGMLGVKFVLSVLAIALIGYLFDSDDRFWAGSRLGLAFILSCVAGGIDLVLTASLIVAGSTGWALGPNSRREQGVARLKAGASAPNSSSSIRGAGRRSSIKPRHATLNGPSSLPSIERYVPPDYTSTESVGARSAYAFGNADFSQLGLGGEDEALEEVPRPKTHPWIDKALAEGTLGPHGVSQIACGGMHTLMLDSNGKVWTWGSSDGGQLGRRTEGIEDTLARMNVDSTGDAPPPAIVPSQELEGNPHVPKALANFSAVRIAAGDTVSVAIAADGEVRTWGSYRCSQGILGFTGAVRDDDPDGGKQYEPISLPGLHRYRFVDATCGTNHCVALTDEGRVVTWGNGEQGQLGRKIIERRKENALQPTILALKDIVAVGAGHYASFAVDKHGRVFAWGLNASRQLGIDEDDVADLRAFDSVQAPTIVSPMDPSQHDGHRVVSIRGGEHFTLFLLDDGSVWFVGRADDGQSGLGGRPLPSRPPRQIRRERIANGMPAITVPAGEAPPIQPALAAAFAVHAELVQARDDAEDAEARRLLKLGPNDALPASAPPEIDEEAERVAVDAVPIPDLRIETPVRVPFADEHGHPILMRSIGAGLRVGMAVSRSGRLYSWGTSAQCGLGLGARDKQWTPMQVRTFPRKQADPADMPPKPNSLESRVALEISCGGDFGFILTSSAQGPPIDAPAGWRSAAPEKNGAADDAMDE